MFIIKYFKKNRIVGTAKFQTIKDAEVGYSDSDCYDRSDRYEIINSETGEIVDEGEIVDADDIIDDMFDGEDSKEGFDWTED